MDSRHFHGSGPPAHEALDTANRRNVVAGWQTHRLPGRECHVGRGRSVQPLCPPRRITTALAHSPSWSGDSRLLLYQSSDKLKLVDLETGETRPIPLDLKYTPAIPAGRVVVHAGRLVDGRSQTARSNLDIVIEGNRIRSVTPHSNTNHSGARLVDASDLTVMPGLIEYHSH